MDQLLAHFFPVEARVQNASGTAKLKLRILSDGRVGGLTLLEETGQYPFGEACMMALLQRRWQPPLDQHGRPVSTEVRYVCEFEVGSSDVRR